MSILQKLDNHQIKFLEVVIPVAKSVQAQTFLKSYGEREIPIQTKYGMFASVIAALCIHRSNWGSHPLAQKKFVTDGKNALPGNNLALVNADVSWTKYRRGIVYGGKMYKSYRDIEDFAQDLSDIYALKYNYEKALLCTTPENQVSIIARRGDCPLNFTNSLLKIIYDYKLKTIDKETFEVDRT